MAATRVSARDGPGESDGYMRLHGQASPTHHDAARSRKWHEPARVASGELDVRSGREQQLQQRQPIARARDVQRAHAVGVERVGVRALLQQPLDVCTILPDANGLDERRRCIACLD